MDALGKTLINETAYAGVWLVRHYSPVGDEMTTHIEITRQPALLLTPEEDLGEAASQLAADLGTEPTDNL